MSKPIVFIQVHGKREILEAELTEATTLGELHKALAATGVDVDDGTFIFVDDAEEHLIDAPNERLRGFKHGCRIHVCRCRRVSVTVNYLSDTAERLFPPGAKVQAVKRWAVHKFNIDPKDAAEHVLQICGTNESPASDTPLHQLLANGGGPHECGMGHGHEHHCELCFDLVPEKRVEG